MIIVHQNLEKPFDLLLINLKIYIKKKEYINTYKYIFVI
jgi:hypothetical protein